MNFGFHPAFCYWLFSASRSNPGYNWLALNVFYVYSLTRKKSPDALGSSLKFTKPRGEATVPSTAANTALLSESF